MNFDVDFGKILKGAIPWMLRKDKTLAIKDTIANVLKGINNQLITYRDEKREEVSITGQIIYLEFYLNVLIGHDLLYERIFIENTADNENLYVYNTSEPPGVQNPDFYTWNYSELGTSPTNTMIDNLDTAAPYDQEVFLYNISELLGDFDFIVWVPTQLDATDWTATTYVVGNTVAYNGLVYECIQNALATDLPTDTAYWLHIGIKYDYDRIYSEVKKYSLAGKRFDIQLF